jgi:hypothetical protein
MFRFLLYILRTFLAGLTRSYLVDGLTLVGALARFGRPVSDSILYPTPAPRTFSPLIALDFSSFGSPTSTSLLIEPATFISASDLIGKNIKATGSSSELLRSITTIGARIVSAKDDLV